MAGIGSAPEADDVAQNLVETSKQTLRTFGELRGYYDEAIARGAELLHEVDETLRRVHEMLGTAEPPA